MPSDPVSLAGLAALVLIAAVLYSSVGHAGASGYLAAMALFGVAPSALVLSILVAVIGTVRFARAGYTPWRLLAPLCVGSVPAAFVGGRIALPTHLYEPLLAALLVVAALRLWFPGEGAVAPAHPSPGASLLLVSCLALRQA